MEEATKKYLDKRARLIVNSIWGLKCNIKDAMAEIKEFKKEKAEYEETLKAIESDLGYSVER